MPILKKTSNYLYDYILELYAYYRGRKDPVNGNRTKPVILLGGGSRSGKTESVAQVILTFMEHFAYAKASNPKKLYINVYRNTSVDSRKTFKDFIKAFDRMGLLPMEQRRDKKTGRISMSGDYETVEQPKPIIRYKGHTIEFMGMPEGLQEAVGCDISFINEILENDNEHAFYSIVRRTEIMTLADWNPSQSVHYIYNIKRYNFHYPVTTYLDNKWLPTGQKADAESQCPWPFEECIYYLESSDGQGNLKKYALPEDFTLEKWYSGYYQSDECPSKFNGFLRRKWLKEERPENCLEEDYHLYRGVNKLNFENGTINRAEWLTYGEGIPSGREGRVFPNPIYIEKFPTTGLAHVAFGLDLGLSIHPTVLTRCGWEDAMTRVLEYLTYVPMRTAEIIYYSVKPHLIREEERQSEELGEPFKPDLQIICDSQDRNSEVGENVVVELLKLAQNEGHYNWHFWKVKKPTILARLEIQKRLKLKVVENKDARSEFDNYILEKGKNNPIDDFNHGHDSWGYCEWSVLRFKK